jgi:hypothetical protein
VRLLNLRRRDDVNGSLPRLERPLARRNSRNVCDHVREVGRLGGEGDQDEALDHSSHRLAGARDEYAWRVMARREMFLQMTGHGLAILGNENS